MTNIQQNLANIHTRMMAARGMASPVTLVAVSKGHDEVAVRAALSAGQRAFGENRVQEAKAKFAGLHKEYPELELHLIGPLQTNKAEDAVKLFDVIQVVDRAALADMLAKIIKKTGCTPRLYVAVNIAAEPQKNGVTPERLSDFLSLCRDTYGLSITGLMCIPPKDSDPTPYFNCLKKLADRHKLPHISMGMSADFETAIQCGATEVRVGSAIFGERVKPK